MYLISQGKALHCIGIRYMLFTQLGLVCFSFSIFSFLADFFFSNMVRFEAIIMPCIPLFSSDYVLHKKEAGNGDLCYLRHNSSASGGKEEERLGVAN